jgi:hypothetical protein
MSISVQKVKCQCDKDLKNKREFPVVFGKKSR